MTSSSWIPCSAWASHPSRRASMRTRSPPMPERIIRNRHVENDVWQTLGVDGEVPAELPHGPVLVPLATWQGRRDELLARREPFGVWLKPDDDPGALAADIKILKVIGVHFPKWGDGRGYSTATLLRGRYDFRGE